MNSGKSITVLEKYGLELTVYGPDSRPNNYEYSMYVVDNETGELAPGTETEISQEQFEAFEMGLTDFDAYKMGVEMLEKTAASDWGMDY